MVAAVPLSPLRRFLCRTCRNLAVAVLASASCAAPVGAVPLPPERPAELTPPPVPPPPPEDAAIAAPGVPLPRPRPEDIEGPGGAPSEAVPPPAGEGTCVEELTRAGAKAEAIAPPPGTGACGIATPVRLTALPDGVALTPAAIVNCAVARTLIDYVGKDVAAAARERLSARVVGIAVATSYDCRPQNHVSGAKMSEHGLGNAVDIGGFALEGGRHVTIGDSKADPAATSFVADVRKASCARFTTVLGPGSDAEHGNHLHLDLRQRSNGYRICQ